MRIPVLLVAMLVAGSLAGCVHRPATAVPSGPAAAVYGRWLISPEAALMLPVECLSASYEFGPDTITMRSGELVLVAAYRLEDSDAGLVFVQSGISHNGRDNCQGVPGEYVASHYQPRLEAEVAGGRLRLYLFGRGNGNFVEFVRMPAQ